MNWKRLGLILILADFVALTAYAVYYHGYLAFFELQAMNSIQIQIFTDLIIALSVFLAWMVPDARSRRISPLPYVLLTLTLGSIGALAYLIRRTGSQSVEVGGIARRGSEADRLPPNHLPLQTFTDR
ncbi:MAG: DUF2834 domain-containing protein [Deltaproteobacteria bacterium]|nr:DUF2834 domain-containing protein [Deltaproteobacteria bacterium]